MRKRSTVRVVLAAGSAAALAVAGASAGAQGLDAGDSLMHAGKYVEAAAAYGRVAERDEAWGAAQRWRVRALLLAGRYDDAERGARDAAGSAKGAQAAVALGEALAARGRTADAEQAFARAIAEHAPDSLTARRELAELRWHSGDRTRALADFDRFIDIYNASGGRALGAEELIDVAIAVRYLGVRDPQLFKDALKAFDRAIAAADDTPAGDEARVRAGQLFLEKYNGADAQASFDAVLQTNPNDPRALVGAARRLTFDGEGGADSLVARALAVNPSDPDAHVLRAELHLDLEEYDAADREADRALAVDPTAGDALAVKAASRYLAGDRAGYERVTARALALDPHDAELFATVAELTARVRRYREAADLAQRAVRLDTSDWRAYGVLGLNQLRLGEIAAGQKSLATSFAGDPYNVWIKNTLDLLDTFRNYQETRTPHFLFVIEREESALLAPYIAELGEQAYARFASFYAYTPPPPIRIEVYRSHADFSVRTVGLAGLGALGVSFGTTLAFDSPAAKDAGPFNWGSTVWHELAHTFTLGSSEHRVPRWLSEGLSVYEERRARPGWGFDVTPAFLEAWRAKKLVPPSRMNDGFMHPAYPQQVMFSYYEASLVCELIARDRGEAALPAMLAAYRAGQTTPQVFASVLHTDPAAFDRVFDAYLTQRFGAAASSLGAYRAANAEGRKLLAAGGTDAAIAMLTKARALFPEYGGDDGALPALAAAYRAKGDAAHEREALAQLVSTNETNASAEVRLADLLEQSGNVAGAATALDAATYIDPFDAARHARLAELWKRVGDAKRVVRERAAVVALAPVDRPEALYQLAVAYRDAGDAARARTTVLRALEDAPNFAKAQELLLALHGEGRER